MSELPIGAFGAKANLLLHRNTDRWCPSMATPHPSTTTTTVPTPAPMPVREEQLELGNAGTMRARVYGLPADEAAVRAHVAMHPLVLHFHGGAFVGGNVTQGSCIASRLADAGAVVLSLDYPLAPAAPFPAAVEAGHAALCWMQRRSAAMRRRSRRGLWLAGEEAGGNLAAAVALMARDRQGPGLDGMVLVSPMLDHCVATASLRQAQAGPNGCRYADGWRQYLSHPDDEMHPYAAPAQASRLAGLPRSLVMSADDDPLRDEARRFAARLKESGVDARFAQLRGRTNWPCSLDPANDDARREQRPGLQGEMVELLRRFFEPPPQPGAAPRPIAGVVPAARRTGPEQNPETPRSTSTRSPR